MEIIDSFPRLIDLAEEWSNLTEICGSSTPFQLPEWLLTWWPHFGSGDLQILVFRSAGKLTGVIPCFRHEWNEKRQLTLIGSGVSDYLEPAISPPHHAEILEGLSKYLESNKDWDLCDWQDLSEDTPLRNLRSTRSFQVNLSSDVDCAHVPITTSFDVFMEGRPRGLRRNLRRYSEKARQLATPEFEVTASADSELFDTLLRLHAERWHKHGEPGMIAANNSTAFLRDVVVEFARRHMLLFFSLRFQEKVVAVILAFRYRNKLFGYLSAFDPELEQLGFGTALLSEALRYAFDNGFESWNFLRGSEPYKFLWGAESISKCRILITRS